MNDAATLRSVLKSLSDGEPVDWDAAESGTAHDDSRLVLQELRVIARISAAHAADPSHLPGARVLPFRLGPDARWGSLRVLAMIGSGADGEVYRAYDDRLQREVALKLLRRSADDRDVSHALDEARLLARVRHPNIVTVHGADVVNGQAGIWMELVSGETLQSVVSRQGPFGADEAALIGAEVCRGLAAIHEAGVLHRDLKAQNVMRESGGRIVVMDFSVSRDGDSPKPGLAGTPVYVAPELFGGVAASPRSDLYSVGVLLYYLVTGKYPIAGATVADIARSHEQQQIARLRDARADLPAAFVVTVDRALSRDPGARPASAGALEADLLQSMTRRPGDHTFAPSAGSRKPRWLWVSAVAASLVIAAGIWAQLPRQQASPTVAVPLEARPWVLVSSFDNRTGNPDLDGVLEYALERELIGSQQFRVASRSRLDDVLRLMQRPIETRVDDSIAREVALRDGGIRNVISGRVEQVGGVTVLSASVIDVEGGGSIASLSAEATAPAALQQAVRQLATLLRAALGEHAGGAVRSARELERVTTPSFRALRLYTESYAAAERDHWSAALNLAQQAVQEDPSFAAAHTWLAWSMMRNRFAKESFMPVAGRGVELSDSASEWERLWISGSFHSLAGDNDRALGAYEALLTIYPDHFWGANNLVGLYHRRGMNADAMRVALRLADLRPNDYDALYLALEECRWQGQVEQAAQIAMRIRAVGIYDRNPSGDAWVFDAFRAWYDRDAGLTLTRLEALQSEAAGLDEELRDAIMRRSALWYLALGRPTDARRTLDMTTPTPEAHLYYATIANSLGDWATARRDTHLARVTEPRAGDTDAMHAKQWVLAVWLLKRSGDERGARDLLTALEPIIRLRTTPVSGAAARLLAAEAAATTTANTDPLRQVAERNWRDLGDGMVFRASETLADALTQKGNLVGAVAVLQKVSAIRHRAAYDFAFWWMRCQLRLAELYQQLGRISEAQALARELEVLLSEAEPGFPMVARVRAVLDYGLAAK